MKESRLTVKLRRSARKLRCYIGGYLAYMMPRGLFACRWSEKAGWDAARREIIERRSRYYCRLADGTTLPDDCSVRIEDYRFPWGRKKKLATYFFDLYAVVKYFPGRLRMAYEFGDVTDEPAVPSFVKSRPITPEGYHTRSVVLKLNAARHYMFVPDHLQWHQKKDMIVCRNVVRQPHRKRFIDMWLGHPMCDVGQTNSDCDPGHEERIKPYMSIPEQLGYKFVCCIEGNDVATNLKWVMASNSIAVMPRPRYETWFMEGTLIPGVHYIEIRPDYTDLIDRLNYYISHPDEAEAIIENAHRYVAQFTDSRLETAIARATARRYFEATGQLPDDNHQSKKL